MTPRLVLVALLVAAAILTAGPAQAGGGGCHRHAQTADGGNTVDLEGFCMSPTVLYAASGDDITFVNRDTVAHNVVGVGWRSPEDLARGDRFSRQFDEAGIYPYTCTYHPGMNGAVVIQTAEQGQSEAVPADTAGSLNLSGIGLGAAILAGSAAVAFTAAQRSRRASQA